MAMATETAALQPDGWSSLEVCKALRITYRQLDLWIRSGLMTPSIARAKGYGSARRFSFEDLVAIELIRQLIDSHVPLPSVKKALRHLRSHELSLQELEQAYLVTDAEDYFVLYYSDRDLDKALREAMQRGRPILSVSLGNVLAATQERIGMSRSLGRGRKSTVQAVVGQMAEAIAQSLGRMKNRALDHEKFLCTVLEQTGAEFGELFLFERSRRKLVLQAFVGLDDEPIQDKREYELGEGLPGLAAQTGEPIIRTYLGGEPRFMKRAQRKGIRFFACVPLKVGPIVVGTIDIASMHPTLPANGQPSLSSSDSRR